MVRRVVLCILARFCFENVWLQLSIYFELTVIQLGYLLYFKPFEGSLVQKLEEFNEWCTMLIISILFCLTKYVPNAGDKYMVGFILIPVLIGNMAVHLYFLLKDTILGLVEKCK